MPIPADRYLQILEELSRTRIFSHLSREKLARIASLGESRRFGRGEILLEENQENHDIYFLIRGSVTVYSGGKRVANYGRAGDIFGEISVVSDGPTSATVVANDEVETIVIDGSVVGGFKSENDSELVTVFYKLFSLSLLEKLKLSTLKARLFEDAIGHLPLHALSEPGEHSERTVEQNLNNTLVTSLAVHSAEQAIVVANSEGRVVRFNLAAESLFFCVELEVLNQPISMLCERTSYEVIYPRLIGGEFSSWSGELEFVKSTGVVFPARVSLSAILGHQGERVGILSIITDITKEKALEEGLRQAQKMEAIGQLAGGIAHNFNNLLQMIMSNISLLLVEADSSQTQHEILSAIKTRVQSGAELTKQLLAFARGGKYQVKPTDLGALVLRTSYFFGSAHMGISIHKELEAGLWISKVDQNQIEQVLLNLFVNSQEAMPHGGELFLKGENVTVEDTFAKLHDLALGRYVKLSVTDTGTGMDEETIGRIFEPFFTTKEMAHGSGLGLASAYGIIKNHGGIITVDSEVGRGTTFDIYLPATEEEIAGIPESPKEERKGTGTILLVDDEEDNLTGVRRTLEKSLGYEVLVAEGGAEALEAYSKSGKEINLVILDLIMPGMGGGETFDKLRELNPNVKVLLASGFGLEGEAAEVMERGCDGFIQKPFDPEELSEQIHKVLDQK